MKVNISDLLDDYTPGQELDFLEDNKKSINLNAVKRNVSKSIARSKGGQIMHFNLKNKVAAACIACITVLSLGGITVNAATEGALFKSIEVIFFNEDGSQGEVQLTNSYTDAEGNKVSEYSVGDKEDVTFSVTESGDGTTTSIETDGSDNAITGGSVSGTLSETPDGEIEEHKEIIVSEDADAVSQNAVFGIDAKKYESYAPGTYEETNSDGVVFEIVVSEDGGIDIHNKE